MGLEQEEWRIAKGLPNVCPISFSDDLSERHFFHICGQYKSTFAIYKTKIFRNIRTMWGHEEDLADSKIFLLFHM